MQNFPNILNTYDKAEQISNHTFNHFFYNFIKVAQEELLKTFLLLFQLQFTYRQQQQQSCVTIFSRHSIHLVGTRVCTMEWMMLTSPFWSSISRQPVLRTFLLTVFCFQPIYRCDSSMICTYINYILGTWQVMWLPFMKIARILSKASYGAQKISGQF